MMLLRGGGRGHHSSGGRGNHERAEQAVLLVEGAGSEEEGIRRPAGGGAAAEGERPEAVDLDRRPVGGVERAAVLELVLPVEVRGVEGEDAAVAEVADEQVALFVPVKTAKLAGKASAARRRAATALIRARHRGAARSRSETRFPRASGAC